MHAEQGGGAPSYSMRLPSMLMVFVMTMARRYVAISKQARTVCVHSDMSLDPEGISHTQIIILALPSDLHIHIRREAFGTRSPEDPDDASDDS